LTVLQQLHQHLLLIIWKNVSTESLTAKKKKCLRKVYLILVYLIQEEQQLLFEVQLEILLILVDYQLKPQLSNIVEESIPFRSDIQASDILKPYRINDF
jgi:hypothetical protein